MPIDVNLEIPTNLYKEQGIWSQNSHSSFGLDQENDHHTKAIVHQEVWVLGLYWEHRGESLWDHIGNIWTQEKSRNFIHHATLVHFGSMLHTPCSTSLFETLSNDHLNLANSIYMSHWKHVKGSKWLNVPKCSIMIFGNHFWNSFTTMDSCMNVCPIYEESSETCNLTNKNLSKIYQAIGSPYIQHLHNKK